MFAEMPLDNRTGSQITAVAAIAGFFRPLETSSKAKTI
jgi:hypothetical protein